MTKLLFAASPYPEGAFNAIVAAAQRADCLDRSLLPPRLIRRSLRDKGNKPDPGSHNQAQASSVRFKVSAGMLESARIAIKAMRCHSADKYWMYSHALAFDKIAAMDLPPNPVVALGMPGASLNIFRQSQKNGHLTVFHAVNAHPEFHNRILQETYGLHRVREELIPSWMVRRQIEEIALANLVLVPSAGVHKQMTEAGVPAHKILMRPYGVDLSFFGTGGQQDGLSARKRPRLLFVGQISYRKGIPFLLKAIRNANVDLSIVGPMVSKSILNDLPLNATYLGVCSRESIRDLMLTHDAFVLPSIEDACALVTLEAASTGLPVITTTANGAHALLQNQDQITVSPGQVHELTEVLKSVEILTPSMRLSRRTSIRETGSCSFDWEVYGNQIIQTLCV